MKSIRNIFTSLFILGGFVVLLNLLHAQAADTTAIQVEPLSLTPADLQAFTSLSAAQVAALISALDATPTMPAAAVPKSATLWSLAHPTWPPLPGNINGLPVWPMAEGNAYLLNDVGFNYAPQTKPKVARRTMSLAPPGFAGSGTNGSGTNSYSLSSYTVIDYGTNLWIAQVAVTNGCLAGIGSNTLADVQYEIQSRTNLAQDDWLSEGFILGSEITNWTPLSVVQTNRPNLFLRLRSWADDGSGLPIWWQLQYFGTTGVDPNGDPMGDGWSNIQKFQNGMNPNVFYTPPAPQVSVSFNVSNSLVTVSWLPSSGPVTGYTLEKIDWQTGQTNDFNLSVGTQSFADDLSSETSGRYWTPQLFVFYSVQAHYANGDSAWGSTEIDSLPSPTAYMANGPQGRLYFAMSGLPSDLSKVRVFRFFSVNYLDLWAVRDYLEYDTVKNINSPVEDGIFEVLATNLTNGVFILPDSQTPPFFLNNFLVQTVRSNGVASTWSAANYNFASHPFVDVRSQLKDNLRFLLRAATESGPFSFVINDYRLFSQPANYVSTGFYGGSDFDALRPIHDNCFYRNFVFDPNHLAPDGFLNTGCFYGGNFVGYNYSSDLGITNFPSYFFDVADFLTATNPTVPSSLLTADQTTWIVPTLISDTGNVATGALNYYGLPYVSVKDAYVTNSQLQLATYNPGDAVPNGTCYRETVQPGFQTDSYYFARVGTDPLPEQDGFSPTNTTKPIIAAVNNSGYAVTVAGYAKLAVTNGYSGVYGYLGQYFDQAYQIADNGTVTTNTTGILSPYGNFFPTQPGGAALVTMPDLDTGERGTCIVHTVSLQLDANHDGSMSLAFSSSDATTLANPMVVWVNNNYDRGHTVDGSDFEQDDLGLIDISKLPPDQRVPDCQYTTNGLPAIPCTRDLEDYFRLWTPGLSAAMSVLPTNYTAQLVLYGDGAIRVFQAVEPDGGTNYLFDETTASNQVANSTLLYVGLLTNYAALVLTNWTNEHFIFCGARAGSATVDLQILNGDQNNIADSQVSLQINDIKQMYERWTVGEKPLVTPKSVAALATDGLQTNPPVSAFQYTPPQDTNTPYILFVHGWNQQTWEKDRYAETAFKRLYWQGYRGRFGSFRWPTDYDFGGIGDSWNNPITDPRNFDNSEFTAWQSGRGLLNKLNDLNAEYPGNVYVLAHSMGNVVTGEALRLAGTNQVVNTYVALQGAVAAHAYDPATTTRALVTVLGISQDSGTPNGYAEYYTNGAPCYFDGSAGAGNYVNFYNTNDYALGALLWQLNQNFKPDNASTPAYHYSSSTSFYKIIGAGTNSTHYLNFPTNTYEIFAYGDEARCYAIGAQANVGGAFISNGQTNQVELSSVLPPDPSATGYRAHKYHSGEFRSDNAQRAAFWDTVLIRMGLKEE